jgi:hypothetical protein
MGSVADTGSGAFLTLGSGMGKKIWDEQLKIVKI